MFIMTDPTFSKAGLRDRHAREGDIRRAMISDRLITGRLPRALRQALAPTRIGRYDKGKLSWRLSFLVILVSSLALWAAIGEGIAVLIRIRL